MHSFAILSYLGSHWMLFIAVVLSVVGLAAASWFLKNWKFAAAAIVLTIAGFAYQASNIDGYKRKAAEDAQVQIDTLKNRILASAMIAAADTQRATADAYLNTQLDALSRETPPNASACLDADAARRVRAIGAGQPSAATVSTRRHPIVLPWRSGRP
jgi:hypothetical protein